MISPRLPIGLMFSPSLSETKDERSSPRPHSINLLRDCYVRCLPAVGTEGPRACVWRRGPVAYATLKADRHDGPREEVPVFADVKRENRLDVGRELLAIVRRPDSPVQIHPERSVASANKSPVIIWCHAAELTMI